MLGSFKVVSCYRHVWKSRKLLFVGLSFIYMAVKSCKTWIFEVARGTLVARDG